jgi:hypothetical protein
VVQINQAVRECRVNTRFTPTLTRKSFVGARSVFCIRPFRSFYRFFLFSDSLKLPDSVIGEVTRNIEFYNLDVIISAGCRVKSHRGTQFRIRATRQDKETGILFVISFISMIVWNRSVGSTTRDTKKNTQG